MTRPLTRIPEELVIVTGPDSRLLIRQWENANGQRFVTVAPQYLRGREWRLSHSGLVLAPDTVRQLAPAIVQMAAIVDGAPVDPMPTQADREESRMP